MFDTFINPTLIRYLCIAGTTSAILGVIISGITFRGRLGERFSPLNHFISELGEAPISRLAWVFNLGLIVCGLFLLPAAISLGLMLPGAWSKLGMAAGSMAAVSLSLVGIFPMNKFTPHIRAAVTYFRAGLLMVLLFSVSIASQPGNPPLLPRMLSLAGLPAILSFTFFLVYSRVSLNKRDNPLSPLETERPHFWGLAVSEWAIFMTTVPWLMTISLGL